MTKTEFKEKFFNALLTTGGIFLRIGLQAVTVIIIARILTPQDYGIFAATIGLNLLFSPLVGLGLDSVAMRNCAKDKLLQPASEIIGLKGILYSFPLIVITCLLINVHILHSQIDLYILITITFSDLLIARFIELYAKINQGLANSKAMSTLRALLPACRFLFALLFLSQSDQSLEKWLTFYAMSSMLGMVVLFLMTTVSNAVKNIRGKNLAIKPQEIREGIYFSGTILANRVHTEADRPILMSLSQELYAGIYAAAYKLYELATVPISALSLIISSKLYGLNKNSAMTLDFINRYILISAILAVPISIIVYLFLETGAVFLLGEKYRVISNLNLIFCWLPIAYSIRVATEQSLVALDLLNHRIKIQAVIAITSISLNLTFIPIFGWHSPAFILLFCEVLLASSYFTLISVKASKLLNE